jgi:hypothetical protein
VEAKILVSNGSRVGTRKGQMRCIWWMCFVSIYENRRMKPVAVVLLRTTKKRRGGRRRMMEGINPTRIYCKHIHKYHNVFPWTTIIR